MKFKIGDKVRVKKYPLLLCNLEIVDIKKDPFSWAPNRVLYITKPGSRYLAEELELI